MTQTFNQLKTQGELFAINEVNSGNYYGDSNNNSHLVALILAHADISIELGNGCVALKISKKSLMRNNFANLSASERISLSQITIIWSDWEASIINILTQNSHLEKMESRFLH